MWYFVIGLVFSLFWLVFIVYDFKYHIKCKQLKNVLDVLFWILTISIGEIVIVLFWPFIILLLLMQMVVVVIDFIKRREIDYHHI